MKLEVAKFICEVVDAELKEDYSGRRMYGKSTAAIIVDSGYSVGYIFGSVIEDAWNQGKEEMMEDILHELKSYKQDSFGLDKIIYWFFVIVPQFGLEAIPGLFYFGEFYFGKTDLISLVFS